MSARQWLASVMICAMIWPLLLLPVNVLAASPAPYFNGVESVNESLPIWISVWRKANAEIETWKMTLTAVDPMANVGALDDKDKKKLEGVSAKETTTSKLDPSKDSVSSASSASTISNVLPDHAVVNSHANASTAAAGRKAVALNQLPSSEHDSIYSYQNNLGSPKGQVEMDSPNMAATLPIKHRVGVSNFSFGLPLASIPGRGIDASVGLTYNSRTWNKSCEAYDSSGNCTTNHFTYDVEQSWIAPGFSSGFGYLETAAMVRSTHPTTNTGVFTYYTEIVPAGITDADGTRHQLGCASSSAIYGTYESRCDLYMTTDGTYIKVPARAWTANPNNSQTANTADYSSAIFTATYNNGSKIQYSGGFLSTNERRHYPIIIQDNNGNRLRVTYRVDQSGSIDYIEDTVNRKIKFYYEPVNGAADRLVAVTIPAQGNTGEIQTVRFYYEDLTLQSGGFEAGSTVTAPATVRTLKYVYIPGTKTGFKYEYNPYFGMISKITRYVGMTASGTGITATGSITDDGLYAASTEYNYPTTTGVDDVPKYTTRTDNWQGNTGDAAVTTYDSPDPAPGGDYVSTIETADNGFKVQSKSISGPDGMLKETSITKLYGPSSQYSQLMTKTEYKWSADNNRNLTSIEVTNDAGLKKPTVFGYDGYNNQTSVLECDFGVASSTCTDSIALRRTLTTYETGSGWISANLLTLPKTVTTIVGGVDVSKTELTYDHAVNGVASDASVKMRTDMDINTHDIYYNNDGQHDAYNETVCPLANTPLEGEPQSPPGGCVVVHHYGHTAASSYRGNVTKVTRFSDAALTSDPNADVSEYNHDIAGNLVSATLSCCNLNTTEYGSTFGVTGYAYPTSETKGTSPTQLITSSTYDISTGLVLASTNENGQSTSYEYEAETLRPKKTIYSNTGYVLTEYSDSVLPAYVRKTTKLDPTNNVQSYAYFNGRGLVTSSATETVSTPSTGSWLISAVEYDNLGRVRKTYDPFYGNSQNSSVPTDAKYTEVTVIDAIGRATEVQLQDGTKVNTYPDESTVTYTAPNSQTVIGTETRVKNQAGRERRQIVDALGRVVRVDEPTASGLGNVSSPSQPTFYEYDGNDNLSKVIQSDGTVTQERRFKYDSLSRLVAERQVEADATLSVSSTGEVVHGSPNVNNWTKVLKYNIHGLLTDGYDARGVHTQMDYDGLNRIFHVTFSGETGYKTPAVTYTYDQVRPQSYNIGALTKIETAAGDATLAANTPATKTEFDYDVMGRPSKHRQWIGSEEYDLEYSYNLAGQLTSEKYPSGHIITNNLDAKGRLSSITDPNRTYLSGLAYSGKGGSLSSMTFGNNTIETFGLNDRMQLESQELKKGPDTIQKYTYAYGTIGSNGQVDSTKNNGQLGQIESYIGTAKQWTQKFSYDEVGRLTQSTEYRGDNDSLTYQQTFDFDRFGNMYRKANNNPVGSQASPLLYSPIEDTDISRATNRLATNTTYDEAGQVTTDAKFRLMSFGYDANGRMVRASKTGQSDALSIYDAAGMRVAERVNDVWRFVVYDIGGKMVAEYGGMQPNDEGGVKYLLSDWQGSDRAVLSSRANVLSRSDYTAFGEEIEAGKGLRTSDQGYGSDITTRQKYGLTERDDATGLDHAWFRKHENNAGRWTSPDPYRASMTVGDPQSFNRYAYVQNQPTGFVDPSGLNASSGLGGGYCIRYHYSNPATGEGFWGPWQCFDSGSGAGGGGNAQTAHNPKKGKGKTPKVDLDKLKKAMTSCLKSVFKTFGVTVTDIIPVTASHNGIITYSTSQGTSFSVETGNDFNYAQLQELAGRGSHGFTFPDHFSGTDAKASYAGHTISMDPRRFNYVANDDPNDSFYPLKALIGNMLDAQVHENGHSLASWVGTGSVADDEYFGVAFEDCVLNEYKKH